MSTCLQAVREDLRVLARMYGAGGGGNCKALCLAVIDRAATCASDRHGEIPDDVLGYLTRAMHAAGREDVAGVIEEVEGALAVLGGQPPKTVRRPDRVPAPKPAGTGKSPSKATPLEAQVYKPKTLAQGIDPLLAKLRGRHLPKR